MPRNREGIPRLPTQRSAAGLRLNGAFDRLGRVRREADGRGAVDRHADLRVGWRRRLLIRRRTRLLGAGGSSAAVRCRARGRPRSSPCQQAARRSRRLRAGLGGGKCQQDRSHNAEATNHDRTVCSGLVRFRLLVGNDLPSTSINPAKNRAAISDVLWQSRRPKLSHVGWDEQVGNSVGRTRESCQVPRFAQVARFVGLRRPTMARSLAHPTCLAEIES
jgi:hypothetical protein